MNAESEHPVFKSLQEAREAIEAALKRLLAKIPIIQETEPDGEGDAPKEQ